MHVVSIISSCTLHVLSLWVGKGRGWGHRVRSGGHGGNQFQPHLKCTGITEEKNKGGLKNDISFRNVPNVIIPFLEIIVDIVKLSYATHKRAVVGNVEKNTFP